VVDPVELLHRLLPLRLSLVVPASSAACPATGSL
jgi:hypothetical protein